MMTHDGTTTSPALLREVRDWRNMPAWDEFFRRYDALLDQWCSGQSLDAAAADEIRETVWIELAHRVRTFRYDPRKSFRGWLRQLCRCRAVDYLRKSQRESRNLRPLDDAVLSRVAYHADPIAANSEEREPSDRLLHDLAIEAEAVQATVRERVKPRTWEIFWQIAILDRPIREVATEFQISYAAAFESYARTSRILREEGDRRRGNPSAT